jgi:hypothetical protein
MLKWMKVCRLIFGRYKSILTASADEDDIPLPPGLPPGTEEVNSDEDIPMPYGPPPSKAAEESKSYGILMTNCA